MTEKTGRLEPRGPARLGWERFECHRCVDCGTDYPEFTQDQAVDHGMRFGAGIYCNGQNIISCPYCTPPGQKYTNPNCSLTVLSDECVVMPAALAPKPPAQARLLLGLGHVCLMVGGWLNRLGRAMARAGAKLQRWS